MAAATADDIEKQFYARCPPEKRPRHLKGDIASDYASEVDDEASSEKDSGIHASSSSGAVAKDVEGSETPGRGLKRLLSSRKKVNIKPRGTVYDESIFRAIYHVFLTKIWVSGILKLLSGTLRIEN